MTDPRQVLERIGTQLRPPTDALQRLAVYRRRRRRRRRVAAGATALLVAAGGTALAALALRDVPRPPVPAEMPDEGAAGPFSPHVADRFLFSPEDIGALGQLAPTQEALWAIDYGAFPQQRYPGRLLRIDPATGQVTGEVHLEGGAEGVPATVDLAARNGYVWVVDHRSGGSDLVHKIDVVSLQVLASVRLPEGTYAGPIAATSEAVWVGGVVRPAGTEWEEGDRVLFRIDPETGSLVARIPVAFCGPFDGGACQPNTDIVQAEGYLWMAGLERGVVIRVDPSTGDTRAFDTGGAGGLAVGEGLLWVAGADPGGAPPAWFRKPTFALALDTESGERVGEPIPLQGGHPDRLEAGGTPFAVHGGVWVEGFDEGRRHIVIARVDTERARVDQAIAAVEGEGVSHVVLDLHRDSIWVLQPYELVRLALHDPDDAGSPQAREREERTPPAEAFEAMPPDCPPVSPGAFELSVDRGSGSAGATVAISGLIPYMGPGDQGLRGPYEEIGLELWWDADPRAWADELVAARDPSSGTAGQAELVLEEDLTGQCAFRTRFTVPDVPPGTYQIVALGSGGRSWALWDSFSFEVTG